MSTRFGIWLLTCNRSFEDPRIWRENDHGYDIQTHFQRVVGVRYVGASAPRFPDAKLGFGGILPRNRHRSISYLFKGHFHPGPVSRQALSLRAGNRTILAKATGYAIFSTRRLKCVSIPGAVFVGVMRVRCR